MSKPIEIGMCTTPDRAAAVAPGYDYLELTVASSLMPLESDEVWETHREMLQALRPRIRGFNSFVPGCVPLVGEDVDWEAVETYVARAMRRAATLGGDFIVFGSGAARMVPERFSRALAWGQLVRFCNLCATYGEREGIRLVIEPLNKTECNIINSYPEAVQLARDVDRPNVRALADIYHFMMDGEPIDDLRQAPEWLAHVHLADTGRLWPGSGSYPLEDWFAILKEGDYAGRASVECGWGDDFTDETARSLAFLRKLAG